MCPLDGKPLFTAQVAARVHHPAPFIGLLIGKQHIGGSYYSRIHSPLFGGEVVPINCSSPLRNYIIEAISPRLSVHGRYVASRKAVKVLICVFHSPFPMSHLPKPSQEWIAFHYQPQSDFCNGLITLPPAPTSIRPPLATLVGSISKPENSAY